VVEFDERNKQKRRGSHGIVGTWGRAGLAK